MAVTSVDMRRPLRELDGVAPATSVLASALILGLIAVGRDWFVDAGIRQVAVVAISVSVVCLTLVVVQYRRHLWAFAPMLLFLIIVFHLGLLLGPLFTGQFQLLSGSSTGWTASTELRLGVWYVAMCLPAFALGTNLVRLAVGPDRPATLVDDGFAASVSRVGSAVLLTSVIAWFAVVLALFGYHAFRISYLDFFQATQSSAVAYANLGIGLGLVLVCVDLTSRPAKVALAAFLVFAVASLSIGARSTTMFAGAAALVVVAYRRAMPRAALMAPIVLGAATLAGFVRLTRLNGLAGARLHDVLFSPLNGLAELGYTIRVVQTSFLWHGVMQEPLLHGATYSAWPTRFVDQFLLGHPAPPSDFRLMNVEISERLGGLGGSILAEAHHNFGVVGGVALTFLLGLFAAWASRAVRTTFGLAVLGTAALPLFIHVRNSFTPVLFTLVCGLTLVVIARLLQRDQARR